LPIGARIVAADGLAGTIVVKCSVAKEAMIRGNPRHVDTCGCALCILTGKWISFDARVTVNGYTK
jgi:hypothetical protein